MASKGITEADVKSLGRKLRELKPSLTGGERRALDAIVVHAAKASGGDVRGFVFEPDDTPPRALATILQNWDLDPAGRSEGMSDER